MQAEGVRTWWFQAQRHLARQAFVARGEFDPVVFDRQMADIERLFRRQWQRGRESREDDAVNGQQPGSKIGHQVFTDGVVREVFQDGGGRQYVLDDADQRIHGHWLPPADEPYIV